MRCFLLLWNVNKFIYCKFLLLGVICGFWFSMKSARNLMKHLKCINSIYPRSEVQRFPVPEEKISWDEDYLEYKPIFYESPVLAGKEWADSAIGEF